MIKRYLKYLIGSKTRYKVHSPFVFDLINQVLKKNSNPNYISDYVSELKTDQTKLEINDLGAGSRKSKTKHRTISSIYQTSSSTPKKADLIRRICEYEMDQFIILELGTNLGVTTFALSQSEKCQKIISIEGCKNLFEYTRKKLKPSDKIELVNAAFDDKLDFLLEEYQPQIVYIDGNHTYEATKRYFDKIQSYPAVELVIFDDINWSGGMLKAWNEIIQMNQFNVSINLFKIGLVYRRQGQRKEDFIIRY